MDGERSDFGVLLSLAHVTFLDELARHMRAEGFPGYSTRYGSVLRLLESGPVSLSELASRLGMTSPGALKLVTAMTADGYLERVTAPEDRRLRPVAVSPRGREALAAARRCHAALEQDLVVALGPDAVAAAREVLEHLADRSAHLVPAAVRRTARGS